MTSAHKAKWSMAAAALVVSLEVGGAAIAQKSLGSMKTDGAEITGMVSVSGGRAVIANSGSITASAGTAEVSLTRGGSVMVCTGSAARLSQPLFDVPHPPLLMALNRGSMEIHTRAEKNDVILTPDLRFEISDAAPLNVRVRLVANGDTCVDNSGKDAPILHATEAFGTGAYFIRPGQRVLFEHGSLREVVDRETSSCGCPRPDAYVLAGKGKQGNGKIPEAPTNSFPEAVSQGLVKPAPTQQAAPVGEVQTQVSSTLAYDGKTNAVSGPPGEVTTAAAIAPPASGTPAAGAANTASGSPGTTPATNAEGAATDAHVTESAPPPAGPNPFRAIGRFFRKLFGGH